MRRPIRAIVASCSILAIIAVVGLVRPLSAAEFKDAVSAYNSGDYATALQILKPLADGGDVQAQIAIGGLYADGRGVDQNYTDAKAWFQRAADQGSSRAQFNIGSLHYHGQGVVRDYAEAVVWFERAASQGYPDAQFMLATMLAEGKGTAKGDAAAVRWYQMAAGNGHSGAQFNLALHYAKGRESRKVTRRPPNGSCLRQSKGTSLPSTISGFSTRRVVACLAMKLKRPFGIGVPPNRAMRLPSPR